MSTTATSSKTNFFIAKDFFVPVSIGRIGPDFKNWFFPKIREDQRGIKSIFVSIRRNFTDKAIIKKHGGEKAITLTLGKIASFIKKQGNGQKGKLSLVSPNVFYVKDIEGALRAVRVSWDSCTRAWNFGAFDIEKDCVWVKGTRIFLPEKSKKK